MNKRTKAQKTEDSEWRRLAVEHRQNSELIEHLLWTGWIDLERAADLIASDLRTNPYGVEHKPEFDEFHKEEKELATSKKK